MEEHSILHGTTNAVTASKKGDPKAVGPTVMLVKVCGVLVEAMVDTGLGYWKVELDADARQKSDFVTRLGVDVLQLPTSNTGNRYVVCFVDYLTKWVEDFATSDQRA